MRSAHFLTILFATTLLIGCGPNVVDITRLANQDGTGYLFWDWDETIYYEGKPFTGLAEWVSEYFPEEIFSARLPFKKGKIDISAGWEAFYASGQIAVRCEEFLGKPKIPYECHNGRHEWWYMTGQMEIRANYKEGRRDGLYEAWHNNGQMSYRANYKEGRRDGLYEAWHNNGQMSERSNYKDGEEEGLHEEWHENGQMSERSNYKDGEEEGLHEEWHENGQISERGNYKEGRRDGLYEAWHNNGQISERGNYKEGEEDGLHEKWHENGQLSKQFLYTPVDGRSYSHIITRASCWDENGDGDNSSCNYW